MCIIPTLSFHVCSCPCFRLLCPLPTYLPSYRNPFQGQVLSRNKGTISCITLERGRLLHIRISPTPTSGIICNNSTSWFLLFLVWSHSLCVFSCSSGAPMETTLVEGVSIGDVICRRSVGKWAFAKTDVPWTSYVPVFRVGIKRTLDFTVFSG